MMSRSPSENPDHLTRAKAAPGLSVCILSRGTTAELKRCLQSVSSIADDLVIVGTRGRQGIAQAAEAFGARLVRHVWRDSYSEARNAGIAQCIGHWVLSMDEDEWLDPAATGVIPQALARPEADAYLLPVRTVTECGTHPESVLQQSCRLFRRTQGTRFEGRSVETLVSSTDCGPHVLPLDDAEVIHVHNQTAAAGLPEGHAERVRLLREDLQRDPDNLQLLLGLGSEYFAAADFRAAEPCLARACELVRPENPAAASLFTMHLVTLRELGLADEAVSAGERAEVMGISSPELTFARGWAHMALREHARAAECFRQSLTADPLPALWVVQEPSIRQYRGKMGLALACMEGGGLDDALQHARDAVEGCPERAETHVLLACVYHMRGDRHGAMECLDRALQLDPDHPDALGMAAPLYQEAGYASKGLDAAERLLAQGRQDPHTYLQQASALATLGRFDEAYAATARALTCAAGDAAVLVDAGRLFALCSDYSTALRCFEEAIILSPGDSNSYFNAGDVLFKLGSFPEAAELYALGLRLSPSSADGHFALGNCHVKRGMLEKAIRSWEKALELNPGLSEALHNLTIARKALSRAA